ncbi:sigma-54-dependent transcriptional regulator [Geotalea uraniireducens]|uniref:Two component, sigma-54 specific, transcriptional regulator, Fis family n=1 Tax=Geotalea uraniireducens (strain Rf4) TaxID=351605 RepID=A5G503_GEOUR|nr:sigma-54 dependent transcriptional regulator [Geotalea uraniireducens]ABQ26871.1 two component, sigma-54 specific, transcriptional regulator, Fis family [Geotalea uraniireducens Rf4]
MRALVIDDENSIRLALTHFLSGRGYEVFQAGTGAEGLAVAQSALPDIVFLDQRLPDMEGEALLHPLTAPEIGASVIMMTAYVELDRAVQAMKNGAAYYFPKPLDLDQVADILASMEERLKLQHEAEHFRQLNGPPDDEPIIGESPQIIKIQRLISLLAKNSSTPVLILGESGSGKELVARSIHYRSGFSGPLVEINCASLSENLLESELFGHEKGAFTDARETKRGLFEIAGAGTIFFDELAEMPLSIQAKLLKVLDAGRFRRVGGLVDIRSNARFMAATNRDIAAMVKRGAFREDLYYRINVLPITVPPLRERGRDVVVLADYFARRIGNNMGKGKIGISPLAMGYLLDYNWPGNVRELKNIIERALILTTDREVLPGHLPFEIRQNKAAPSVSAGNERLRPLCEVEDEYIAHVLQVTGNNHSRTAATLGISRSTLLAKLKKKRQV